MAAVKSKIITDPVTTFPDLDMVVKNFIHFPPRQPQATIFPMKYVGIISMV